MAHGTRSRFVHGEGEVTTRATHIEKLQNAMASANL